MVMAWLIALPFLAAVSIAPTRRYAPWLTAPLVLGAPLGGLALLATAWERVKDGGVIVLRQQWLPELGLNLTLRLDGLAFAFAVLVLGIGLLVIVYARYYLSSSESNSRFFALLLLFMSAMLGVVLSGNLLLLVVFWELTSIFSFLLIGFWSYRSDARKGARMALTVTGGGGFALLAAVLLLGHICGSLEIGDVLAQAGLVQRHPLYPVMLVLVLLAVFTKSAQFPFHFWLPHAMAAPTPVSAYLHSATMVKAGVFLLARLYPVLDGTDWWFYLVAMTGLATLLMGAAMALLQRDLKGLLAYSTISHLGLITLLFGLDTRFSTVAALFHIFNHAVFKASLFMAAGIIDHETGTRDMGRLRGLARYMPHTALLAIVASLSMAGVPLLNGFLSKEMFFGETLAQGLLGTFNWTIPAAATLAGALTVAYSLRFIYGVFFDGRPDGLPKYPPHEPPRWMKIPVEVLVVICLVVGIFPGYTVAGLLTAAAIATMGPPLPSYHLSPWHGFNTPLVMSLISMAAGTTLFALRRDSWRHYQARTQLSARDRFESAVEWFERLAARLLRLFEDGSLQNYLAWLIGIAVLVPALYLLDLGSVAGPMPLAPIDVPTAVGLAVLALSACCVVVAYRNRMAALILLSLCGLMVSLAFTRFSAPDLALTQISVEVVTIILLVLALYFLPVERPARPSLLKGGRDIAIAVLGGLTVGGAAFAVMTRPYDTIASFFLTNSVEGGGGHNVVNVILVDFRGFDTLGEICVLLLAGLGVQAMLKGLRLPVPAVGPQGLPWSSQSHPLLLAILARLMLPLTAMVAIFVLLRGHNLPGGGFIAALITSVALLLQYVASGVLWTEERITLHYRGLAGAGILIAGLVGLGSWAFGAPFLTSAFGHFELPLAGEIELATAMAFDLGVYLTVVGTTLLIVSHLGVRDKRSEHRAANQESV
ncbi:monovalent cation/H+ antiporter subunit A [Cupriavidus respiraculi]|uniref:monovalent cation/H+ antiporter subunit A n=1 Tax=Cupriavidus respiraculi TaxID=195930 RepID=UPI001C94FFF4|nr:monovalent cation/H+ antiporter subunit A [Cupriavidus respiraculi]MBY4947649.1 monovalent cation/H+ antiporter subunit A [Cupriavidus respiraculi]